MIRAFQDFLVQAIPFLIPAVLVASWLVNHKTPSSSKSSSETKKSEASKVEDKPAEVGNNSSKE